MALACWAGRAGVLGVAVALAADLWLGTRRLRGDSDTRLAQLSPSGVGLDAELDHARVHMRVDGIDARDERGHGEEAGDRREERQADGDDGGGASVSHVHVVEVPTMSEWNAGLLLATESAMRAVGVL